MANFNIPEKRFHIEINPSTPPLTIYYEEASMAKTSSLCPILHLAVIVKLLSSLGLVHIISLPDQHPATSQNSLTIIQDEFLNYFRE